MLTSQQAQSIREAKARRDWTLITYAQSLHSLTDDPYAAEQVAVAAQQALAEVYQTVIAQLETQLFVSVLSA